MAFVCSCEESTETLASGDVSFETFVLEWLAS